jgi:undecaprenyl pyrophosphate phosphatase UppP
MFVHPGLSRRGSSYLYGFKMVFGRGLCIEFLFLLHGIIVFESCAGFRLSQGRAKGY